MVIMASGIARGHVRATTTTTATTMVESRKMAAIRNGNRIEWSTIQGVIGQVISNRPSAQREADLKLRARLPLNCTT